MLVLIRLRFRVFLHPVVFFGLFDIAMLCPCGRAEEVPFHERSRDWRAMIVIAPSERYEGTFDILQNNAPSESDLIYVSCAKCLLPLYAPAVRYYI